MYETEKQELADICRLLYERRLVFGADGNVSRRTSDGKCILLTPSGVNKGMITADRILVVDMDGCVSEGAGKPSKEYPMHRLVYERRPDVGAVIHTHPIYVTAFAVTGSNLPDNICIESAMLLKKTALTAYATPGTMEMAESIRPFIDDTDAILLRNHGALTVGRDLPSAFNKMECMESTAQTIIMSKLLGEAVPISEENIDKMRDLS
jgi:L-fuculose-phosphate aldolase